MHSCFVLRLPRGPAPSHLQPVMAEQGDDIMLVSERRLVIGPLSSSSGTGQAEHTSGASQCESDASGFSRVAAGASAQTGSQEASERGCAGPTVNVRNEWRASAWNEIWYKAPRANLFDLPHNPPL